MNESGGEWQEGDMKVQGSREEMGVSEKQRTNRLQSFQVLVFPQRFFPATPMSHSNPTPQCCERETKERKRKRERESLNT